MAVYKVKWETDGKRVSLPKEVDIPSEVDPEEVADWLSDQYGWLVSELENRGKEVTDNGRQSL